MLTAVLDPSGHGWQVVDAARNAYIPVSHATHPVLAYLSANVPAGQLTHAELPDAAENVPGLHCRHVAELMAASVVEYLPASQLKHDGPTLYCPMPQ